MALRHIHDDAIWTKSDILSKDVHAHDPFIVLNEEGEPMVIDTLEELLNCKDDDVVLWQWKGAKASHFFETTVGEIRAHA
jgi:hypothetical protein